ncbi:GH92 family glycosyl hydrolase [Kitasatospora sp. GP82]|uniref:GH92 family glycosyl hydrolase n=1 Tax=Kitasatospora sp. GP82 TaxID=3035089 RepID=UPI002473469F|nr:GH92 family glycosyl hydrolase [Kitasatospora sp. GP82]MDH6128290.1 putative alpha-1,2-mannosidase [Kitasatospora sp. GP82]
MPLRRSQRHRPRSGSRRIGRAVVSAALVMIGLSPAAPASADTAPAPVEQPSAPVNPLIGTLHGGMTFPGPAAPFGMVQLSPDTLGPGGAGYGYSYAHDTITGFSQTHLSGAGCYVNGEVPILPTTGAVTSSDPSVYATRFSHADEQASAGYYRVGLANGVNAELTATARTGWQRYTFPAGSRANVLVNTGYAHMPVDSSEFHVVGDRTVEGKVTDGRFCGSTSDRHTLYFTAAFDRPFTSFGTWRGSTLTPGSRDSAGTGGAHGSGGWLTFGTDTDRQVVAKVGISYTGIDGARRNLAAETPDYDFDRTRRALTADWDRQLRSVRIGGADHDHKAAFCTALYHALLHPNLIGDVDGRYPGADGRIHTATDWTPYANFSLWDTSRTQNQLLELLTPTVARDIDLSLLAIHRESGWLPRWSLENSETGVMTGDPVTPFLVDGWSKGLLAGHEEEAYQALLQNVTQVPPADSPFSGRSGNPQYTRLGYVPYLGANGCPGKNGQDNDCQHPVSATLEYAAADASLALMAEALGHHADAALLTARGQNYRTLWNAGTGFFGPRNPDGSWVSRYDPVSGFENGDSNQTAFHEGGGWQYRWLVPQDPAGLIGLLGGNDAATAGLDSFFAYPRLLADPAGAARSAWVYGATDYFGRTAYDPNNEPDLLSPYLYLWTGRPDRTATVTRAAETLFTNSPDGITGNDDLGTMSAWYVLTALGLYPGAAGTGTYLLTAPQFPLASVTVGPFGDRQGGTVVISAPGADQDTRYVVGADVNGRPWKRTWLTQSSLAHGARLDYRLASSPRSWGTGPADAPPAATVPGSTATATLHLPQ